MGAFGIKLVEIQAAQSRDFKDAFPQRRHSQRQTGALLAQNPTDGTVLSLRSICNDRKQKSIVSSRQDMPRQRVRLFLRKTVAVFKIEGASGIV